MGRLAISRGKGPFDTTPDSFTFTPVTGVPLSTLETSNTITISGLTPGVSVAATITGGQYSKNGGAAASAATTAVNGDTFAVLLTSSALNSTLTSAVLTVGGVAGSYDVTTTSSSIPASVNAPVQGTDLTAVWNLQTSGTGPRSGPTNGTWAGSIDSYLANIISPGVGFVIGNDNGALYLNAGSSTVTISNYDFTLCPRLQFRGTGTVNFVDCTFDRLDGNDTCIRAPLDINGNWTGENITANFTYCDFNVSTTFADTGTWTWDHCSFRNQVQQIWGSAGSEMLVVDCYITGGGCNPPSGAHVELIQYNATVASGLKFKFLRVFFNPIDGQGSLADWGGAWTGLLTTNVTGIIQVVDSIIDMRPINNNPLCPLVMGCTVFYNDAGTPTITNSVLVSANGDPGGYTGNGSGGSNRPTVSGNRTYANVALTAGDFG